jgi:DNA-binding transcriptional LysR family regulator
MHFTLFASRDYIRTHGRPASVSDLSAHRVLDLALDAAHKGNLAMWAKFSGRTALLTSLNGALCEAVRYGSGIALLPSFAPLLDRTVVPVLPAFSLQLPLHLSFDRDLGDRPAVRTVIDYLRDKVFDRRSMPWFEDAYVAPSPDWHARYKEALAGAAAPKDRARTRTQGNKSV